MTRLAVVYYSSKGTIDTLARRCADTAERLGAEVRLRHVHELAPLQAINADERWRAHVEATADEPPATVDDVLWADAVLLGTPTRFGNLAGQLMAFLESLGPQWREGLLAHKVYAGFTASASGPSQECTLLSLYTTIHHFGGVVVTPTSGDSPLALDELTGRVLAVAHALEEAA
jgi:NAD(P)H dehydrogenase (quinone)